MKIYNRKERLQISKKLKSGSGKGNLPKNKNEPNWRFSELTELFSNLHNYTEQSQKRETTTKRG
jgi:hypothetical protein